MADDRERNVLPGRAAREGSPAARDTVEVLCSRDSDHRGAGTPEDGPWWHPGVVVVEFKQAVSPDSFEGPLVAGDSEARSSVVDLVEVKRIINSEGLVRKPKWTFEYHPDSLLEPDRQRFVTFYLTPESLVENVARQLRGVQGVVAAAPEPRLAPPLDVLGRALTAATLPVARPTRALLGEPLAVSGQHPLGRAVEVHDGIQNQWYIFRCKADAVLAGGKSGSGVVVADIDWGFRLSHRELSRHVEHTWNARTEQGEVTKGPRVSHGTGVLGILWAGDNDEGMLGFAHGAALWAIQADDGSGTLDNELWAKAIDHVRNRDSGSRPKVMLIEASTELGGNVEMSITISDAIKRAINAGVVVCVAAGNGGISAGHDHSVPPHPIPETGSILVGATRYDDPDDNVIKRGPSNFGRRIIVSAPGGVDNDVTCCNCGDNSYTNMFGGTSGSAAKVAGTIALMLQENPRLKHEQIRNILNTLSQPIPTPAGEPIGTFLNTEMAVSQARIGLKHIINRAFDAILRRFSLR